MASYDPWNKREMMRWHCSDAYCGQSPNMFDSRWRWTGERWEHFHGWQLGHVRAIRRGRAR